MDEMTRNQITQLYAANVQVGGGFKTLVPALRQFKGTDSELKKMAAIADNYEKIVELFSVIQKDMKSLL
jgi:hypothetical protein